MCSVAQSCLTLYDPVDCSPPGSSVHGILQARILEWVAVSSSRGSSRPGIEPHLLHLPHGQVDSTLCHLEACCCVIFSVLSDEEAERNKVLYCVQGTQMQ